MKRTLFILAIIAGAMMLSCNPKDDDVINNPGGGNGQHNGHGYVDLGLPSGLKWATCNVGASSPEGYGNYYAWGEITTKDNCSSSNCAIYNKTIDELKTMGYIDESGNLTPSHDAATANWGGSWRMPTKAEMEEMKSNCTWEWTTLNDVNGYKVTSKTNGNHIFLPAAGYSYSYGSSLDGAGSEGGYWSSTPDESNANLACFLYFNGGYYLEDYDFRNCVQSVRPVVE